MSNYMTIEEFHKKLGQWLKDNPEHKNELVIGSTVADGYRCADTSDCIPGAVVIGLATRSDDDGCDRSGTLEIGPPKIGKYVM